MRLVLLGLLLSAAPACDGFAPLPAGASCTESGDCASGLMCLEFDVTPPGGTCHAAGRMCSKACQTDADCGSLGTSYRCFGGCGSAKLCAAAAGP